MLHGRIKSTNLQSTRIRAWPSLIEEHITWMKFIRWSNCKGWGYCRFCSGRVLFRFTSTPFYPSFRASFYWQSDLHLNLFVAPTPEEMERENFGSCSGVAWRKWHTFYFYLRPAFTVPWERFSLMHGLPGGCFRASLPTTELVASYEITTVLLPWEEIWLMIRTPMRETRQGLSASFW